MDWNVEWIGVAAGLLTTCAFFPQVMKTLRSRSTGDLSWAWLVMMTTGVFMWLIYGYFAGSPSVFTANVITFFSLVALLWVKISGSYGASAASVYAVKKRKVGKCIGCGQCEKGCPLIVEYRTKIDISTVDSGQDGRPAG
jgi:MtN3 and saliva related transmembrane protein